MWYNTFGNALNSFFNIAGRYVPRCLSSVEMLLLPFVQIVLLSTLLLAGIVIAVLHTLPCGECVAI